MGRKTNPKILRISTILHTWNSRWFSDRRSEYRARLLADLTIRNYLARSLRNASISKVEIARDGRQTTLTIHTSRPAVVIGRGGSGIEKIQKDLLRLLGRKEVIKINVQEIRNPDIDAEAVATQMVEQIERRIPYRRVLKQAVKRSMQAGALGVRTAVSGRLNGAEISRREWLAEGSVPLHTFRADVAYAARTAYTTYGTIGVKVWIHRGTLLPEEEKPGEERKAAVVATERKRSLAERARVSLKVPARPRRTTRQKKTIHEER